MDRPGFSQSVTQVGVASIRKIEVALGEIPATSVNKPVLGRALEAAGVEFINENSGGSEGRSDNPV